MRMLLYMLFLSFISISIGVQADSGPPEDLFKDLEKGSADQHQPKSEQDMEKQFYEEMVNGLEIDENLLKQYLPEELVDSRAYLTNPNVLQYLASAIEEDEKNVNAQKVDIEFWTNRVFRTFVICMVMYWLHQHVLLHWLR